MRKVYTIAPIIFVLALILFFASTTIVPAGSTGVVVHLGKVSDETLSEGFHFKAPFIETVVDINNKIQIIEVDADSVSRDLQSVKSTVAINYRLASNYSAYIYQNVGMDYQNILIAPALQEAMKNVSAAYSAEELITKRSNVAEEVKTNLNERLNDYGIYIEKFNIVNFDFSAEFNNAIEAKQVAEQNLVRTKTEQEEAIVIANAEAEKIKIAADADAKAIKIAADAKAEAMKIEADAQAEANKKIEESITDNILIYKQLETWDGVLPKVVGGNSSGFIFNIDE